MDFESFDTFIERMKQRDMVKSPQLSKERLLEVRKKELYARIDQALDERNQEDFFRYSDELKAVEKNFVFH